jgi:uncharacterized protein YqgC (DUF456 family)
MIGRVVSSVAGQTLARTIGGAAAGPAGAVLGIAVPFVAKRLGPFGLAGMAIGALVVNRIMKERAAKAAADFDAVPKP